MLSTSNMNLEKATADKYCSHRRYSLPENKKVFYHLLAIRDIPNLTFSSVEHNWKQFQDCAGHCFLCNYIEWTLKHSSLINRITNIQTPYDSFR